ncbi:vesicle transport protein USE1 [Chrysoperla carnea]|uniref:vesicle transport protein USE1 n=1 Tax=Chrysoperla carnea TaxID=189513 RepID=UPI001D090C9F|nr:vesicle transport protein USE1 [Chrysoperla carnea]
MAISRTEVNIRRLIAKCELMVKDKGNKNEDRLEKYIDSLDDMLIELEKANPKPNYETILEYTSRIQKLKQSLSKNLNDPTRKRLIDNALENSDEDNVQEKVIITQPKFKNIKDELLGLSENGNNSKIQKNENNVDMLLNYHGNMQEKIAEEMLILTRNLKEQTMLAGDIIRKDTQVLKKSSGLAESNFDKLKTESEKLTEHSKRAWKCWMWVMIFVVMAVFINMVLFMKVMKKRIV